MSKRPAELLRGAEAERHGPDRRAQSKVAVRRRHQILAALVHVWFYRHVRGDNKAGLPGHAPFPTLFHPLVTLSNLEAFASSTACK